jgi:membrane associated rhomboid family serine protease
MLPLRDYAPTRHLPIVTIGLIAANFAVWGWELHSTGTRIDHYSYYPCAVEGPCLTVVAIHHLPFWESAFSSMFMHASWEHILGNMLFLWIFGNNVEDALGRLRFLLFYLAAGLIATAGQTFVTLHWAAPIDASVPNLGASGAIAGVLGAYLVLLPGARVLGLIGIFPVVVPAALFLVFWFGFQLWQGGFSITHPEAGGGVAFFAHIAGFTFGLIALPLLKRNEPLVPA